MTPKQWIWLFLISVHLPVYAGHTVASAYTCTYIRTTQDDAFYLHAPALNYTGDFKSGGFSIYVSASALLPLWGRQEERNYYHPDYYSHYVGTDLFLGVTRKESGIRLFHLIPVVGWHLNGIRLRGKPSYWDFYSLTTGFGLKFLAEYQGSWNLLNHACLSLSWDTLDLLYQNNKLKRGHTISLEIGRSF